MSIYQKLVRKHLLNLKPYSSARDEYSGKEGVFLDANENPFGSVSGENLNRYPDPKQWEIKEKLGKLKGCKPENIFLGNGSDEAIDLLIKSLCEPKEDQILILPPTYGMYQVCADIQQVEVIESNLSGEFQPVLEDIDKKIGMKTKMVWICSPNNPTGNLIDSEAIEQLLQKYGEVVFVIDEAYIDFTDSPSFISRLVDYQNLVVLQTFSKAWGLAGLRVGMAFAHTDLIKILNKIKYPYNLNIQSQRLILEALGRTDRKQGYVKHILAEKKELETELAKLALVQHVYTSDSNQLLVRFHSAKIIFQELLKRKIIVRDRTNVVLCQDCFRISIGTKAENLNLLNALKEIAESMPQIA